MNWDRGIKTLRPEFHSWARQLSFSVPAQHYCVIFFACTLCVCGPEVDIRIFFSCSLPYFLHLSLNLELINLTILASQQVPGILLPPQHWDYKHEPLGPHFKNLASSDLSLGFHAYVANTLLMEPVSLVYIFYSPTGDQTGFPGSDYPDRNVGKCRGAPELVRWVGKFQVAKLQRNYLSWGSDRRTFLDSTRHSQVGIMDLLELDLSKLHRGESESISTQPDSCQSC